MQFLFFYFCSTFEVVFFVSFTFLSHVVLLLLFLFCFGFAKIFFSKLSNIINSAAITINDDTEATPYPSLYDVTVSPPDAVVESVVLRITGLSHSYSSDLEIILESPDGTRSTIIQDCGGSLTL